MMHYLRLLQIHVIGQPENIYALLSFIAIEREVKAID
jgi:hypothetical protein